MHCSPTIWRTTNNGRTILRTMCAVGPCVHILECTSSSFVAQRLAVEKVCIWVRLSRRVAKLHILTLVITQLAEGQTIQAHDKIVNVMGHDLDERFEPMAVPGLLCLGAASRPWLHMFDACPPICDPDVTWIADPGLP